MGPELVTTVRLRAQDFDEGEPLDSDEADDTLDQTDEFPAEELPPDADELPRDAEVDERDLGDLPD